MTSTGDNIKEVRLYRLAIDLLNSNFTKWDDEHPEELTLFQIIQYGDFEPIHTKFLYWLLNPKYHTQSYKEIYVEKFLELNNILIPDGATISVYCEDCSKFCDNESDPKRRTDISITINKGNSKRRVIIENKIFSELTEVQVRQEVEQHTSKDGDTFIALLLDTNKYQFDTLISTKIIRRYVEQGIRFKLFTYSNWYDFNENFNKFNQSEKLKVHYLNENIKKLIEMKKINEFSEDYKTYLKSYDAVMHYEGIFSYEMRLFLDDLKLELGKRSIKEYKKSINRDNVKTRYNLPNGFIAYINLSAAHLTDNHIWLGVYPPKKFKNMNKITKKLNSISGFKPSDKDHGAFWIELPFNHYNFAETKRTLVQTLLKIKKIVSTI